LDSPLQKEKHLIVDTALDEKSLAEPQQQAQAGALIGQCTISHLIRSNEQTNILVALQGETVTDL
jgi:hypothetical protein